MCADCTLRYEFRKGLQPSKGSVSRMACARLTGSWTAGELIVLESIATVRSEVATCARMRNIRAWVEAEFCTPTVFSSRDEK